MIRKSLKTALAKLNPIGSGEIGIHSIRKGASTFVSAGSTVGPSFVSICLRCGWSLGSVFERYMHYERAGDQFVGRVVAGLPFNNAKFPVLPPHFKDTNSAAVLGAISATFPALADVAHLRGILDHGLASLVHHSNYILDILPTKHTIFHTAPFRPPLIMVALKAELVSTMPRLQPSGISPYIEVHLDRYYPDQHC
ncbi:hypothetical protein DYB26_009688 [Aphanomyces astaci]|uniref:Uncharacterized protein n=1 Tax=Aphanomyces astaci TaxID=112090 RepID=A0A397C9A9_APHAT|nr:hypothetical protein DYB38_013762 [Aphanomyces astaci]RHZ08587.1 hypothetical protein DYB26_009688 [Aphanomyces astaci]